MVTLAAHCTGICGAQMGVSLVRVRALIAVAAPGASSSLSTLVGADWAAYFCAQQLGAPQDMLHSNTTTTFQNVVFAPRHPCTICFPILAPR